MATDVGVGVVVVFFTGPKHGHEWALESAKFRFETRYRQHCSRRLRFDTLEPGRLPKGSKINKQSYATTCTTPATVHGMYAYR